MSKLIEVSGGTHFQNATAWVKAEAGDKIELNDGSILTLVSKNPKSGIFKNECDELETISIKRILPYGSDRYIVTAMRSLLNEIVEAPSYLDNLDLPDYSDPRSLALARRIIRACTFSTTPKADILKYISNGITKVDAKLSDEAKQNAGRIAAMHITGEFPAPMHTDNEYAAAEWRSFGTWYFDHNRVKQVVIAAENIDKFLRSRVPEALYNSIFSYNWAKSCTTKASSLKNCLSSWFDFTDKRSLTDMHEAYGHLTSRIESQCERMEFLVVNWKVIFNPDTSPQELSSLLLNSPAQDLLKTILVRVHNIEFGSGTHDSVPQFNDLQAGNVTIENVIRARAYKNAEELAQRNEFARATIEEANQIAGLLEEIQSVHLPYINRRLTESGHSKFEKQWDKYKEQFFIRINVGTRNLSLPACDMADAPLMAKQYFCVLSEARHQEVTYEMLDKHIRTAEEAGINFLAHHLNQAAA